MPASFPITRYHPVPHLTLSLLLRAAIATYILAVPSQQLLPMVPLIGLSMSDAAFVLLCVVSLISSLYLVRSRFGFDRVLIIFFIPYILSICWSVTRYPLGSVFLDTYSYFSVFLLLFSVRGANFTYLHLVKLFSWSSIIAGLFSITLSMGWLPIELYPPGMARLLSGLRTDNVIDNSIAVAGVLCGLTLFMEYRRTVLASATVILSFATLLLGQSRARITFALVFLVGFLAVITFGRFQRHRQRLWQIVAVLLVGAVGVGITMSETIDRVLFRFTQGSEGTGSLVKDSSYLLRQIEARKEIALAMRDPLFGNGWGLFDVHTIWYDGEFRRLHGHNMYTALCARVGFPMVILFVFVLIWLLLHLISRARKEAIARDRLIFANSALLLIYILAIGISGSSIKSPVVASLFLLVLAPFYLRPPSGPEGIATPQEES